ncbi:hypothetical protein C9374_000356 [Naegleria lovaniensis]|uniref:Uncharacterized protein n=1 Tax=Naegleria lovaniensis TaxID=51637 RepID=A0AA88KU08_NAELO|nr:uncharacterized protein C9374_000356 [Naegleria lovaniensis]KAG2388917.1 hypothetical protein C9374_000356 [Naegleria lovaniensis]
MDAMTSNPATADSTIPSVVNDKPFASLEQQAPLVNEESSSILKRKREEAEAPSCSEETLGEANTSMDVSNQDSNTAEEESTTVVEFESQTKKTKLEESNQSSSECNTEEMKEVATGEELVSENSSTDPQSSSNEVSEHNVENSIMMDGDTSLKNVDSEVVAEEAAVVVEEELSELTLLYDDKDRALNFYQAVFGVEVICQHEECTSVPQVEGATTNHDSSLVSRKEEENKKERVVDDHNSFLEPDFKLKGYKLRGTLSPKKKQANARSVVEDAPSNNELPTSKIYVPADQLQSTLEKIKEFSGAVLLSTEENSQEFPAVICPEGNKLVLVPSSV